MGFIDCFSPEILTTTGLLFDMVGATFIAYEVVRQFRGKSHDVNNATVMGNISMGQSIYKTDGFKSWEARKMLFMKIGLLFLLSGFSLQIVAVWI